MSVRLKVLFSIVLLIFVVGCSSPRPSHYSPYQLTQVNANLNTSIKNSRYQNKKLSSQSYKNVSPRKIVKTTNGDYYVVKKGDTLFSIAFLNNKDVGVLARINDIKAPYTLYVGQKLLLNSRKSSKVLYRVQNNDTLFSISKKYSVPVSTLKSLNGISAGNKIVVGQVLVIKVNGSSTASNLKSKPSTTITNKKTTTVSKTTAITKVNKPSKLNKKNTTTTVSNNKKQTSTTVAKNKNVNTNQNSATKKKQATKTAKNSVNWQWPHSGKVIKGFSSSNKGINVSGKRGDSIKAAADGKIVYAGNALRGYGNLIIINHNDEFLSAYAHNDSIKVSEGSMVKKGQVIATMGDSDSKLVCLHFEIRYRGESVDPTQYLP